MYSGDTTAYIESLFKEIEVLHSDDIAETVARVGSTPRYVNISEFTVFPTAQAL